MAVKFAGALLHTNLAISDVINSSQLQFTCDSLGANDISLLLKVDAL
jgi:hypothetical protein